MADVPITYGQGQASIAAETIGTHTYQQIKVIGGETGSTSVLGVNPDRSINVSVLGIPNVVIAGGSVAVTFAASANQSVSGAVTAPAGSVMMTAQLAGSVMAVSGSFNITNTAGSVTAVRTDSASVITTQPAGSILAISGTVTAPAGSIATTVHPAGSITAIRSDNASVITTQPAGSILAVAGTVTAAAGSILAVRTDSASVITVDTVVGSVVTLFSQSPSVVGTYAEDAAHTSGDKGILSLSVRNDTMASVTSADGDYGAIALGPVGEAITANSPITKWIQGTADLRTVLGTSVAVLAAQGTSVFTYVTAVQVANMGSASVLVTLAGGLGSILGYTIAPAGGGSNIIYPNALKTGANSQFSASLSGTASVLVSAQGFIAKI